MNFSEHQLQLAGGLGNSGVGDEPRDFEVGLDLQGEGIRQLSNSGGDTIEIDEDLNQCIADRAAYEAALLAGNIANEALEGALENIIEDAIPSDAAGVIVSNNCIATILNLGTPLTDGFSIGQLKYARAGGAGNFIEAKSPQDMWADHYGIDPAGGPNLGVSTPNCAMRIVGPGYVGPWELNPSIRMDFAGLHLAGDTAVIEGQWQKDNPAQSCNENPFTIFTVTATSPSSLSFANNIGSYYAQDDR